MRGQSDQRLRRRDFGSAEGLNGGATARRLSRIATLRVATASHARKPMDDSIAPLRADVLRATHRQKRVATTERLHRTPNCRCKTCLTYDKYALHCLL